MSTLFLLFVALVASSIAYCMLRWLPPTHKRPGLLGLALWLCYGAAVGYTGLVANTSHLPPGLFYLLAPTVMLVVFTARSNVGLRVATSVPLWVLTGMESFRLVVEGFLHALWLDGRLPTMLTFHGANYDIVVGATAPLVAWLVATRRIGNRMTLAWHFAGIAFLANVVVRAVLSVPGPVNVIRTEVPNLAVVSFPFEPVRNFVCEA